MDEIKKIKSNLEEAIPDDIRQQNNQLRKAVSILTFVKIIGSDTYKKMMSGKIETNSFLEYITAVDKISNLRFWVIMQSLNNVYCRPGFPNKIKELLLANHYSTEFELRMASLFENMGWPVDFNIPLHQKGPDFQVDWAGINVGIECKWKPNLYAMRDRSVINTLMNSVKKAQKKFANYAAGFIFIGGYLSFDKFTEIEQLFTPVAEKWLDNNTRINGIFIYPIIEEAVKEKGLLASVVGRSIVLNKIPKVDLASEFIDPLISEKTLIPTGFHDLEFGDKSVTREDLDRIFNITR